MKGKMFNPKNFKEGREGISRRQFLKFTSLGAAGAYITIGIGPEKAASMMAMMEMGRGGTIIDPPPGSLLKDPVEMRNLSTTPGVVEVAMDVKVAPLKINGATANLLTYNGYFPGPTIRVKRGDILRARLKNSLPPTAETNILGFPRHITNLHTHGWHVSPSGNSDNIFLNFRPGDEFLFEYNTTKQEAGTLNFYHPHVHGLVAEQIWSGLAGALVVEDETNLLSGFETHILVLKDIALSGSEPKPYTSMDFLRGKEGDIVMVNGQINPVLPIRPGQIQRWRIVNASTARFYKLSLENHLMYLVGADGGLLDKPYRVTEMLLSPGERIDILVKADKGSGKYRFLSLPYSRGGNTGQTVTLMTISYEGNAVSNGIPAIINPKASRLNMDISSFPRRRLVLEMRMGRALINGQDFEVNPYLITSRVGTYEVWEIINWSGMDHPFHHHVNPAQVLEINGGDRGYGSLYTSIPAWKDTTIVPRWGSVKLLMPVKDYTGNTVFHCHIVEHEDIGMMGIWMLG